MERFTEMFDLSPGDDAFLQQVLLRAEELIGDEIPIVLQHNDFGPWNVHRAGDRVTVIDWEFDGKDPIDRAGLPMEDLVYFAVTWLSAARRHMTDQEQQQTVADLFAARHGSDVLVTAAREGLASYMQALHLPPRFRGVAIPMTWIRRATAHAARSGPDSPPCQRHVGFFRALARHPEDVLGDHA
jgi:hypothetical protein